MNKIHRLRTTLRDNIAYIATEYTEQPVLHSIDSPPLNVFEEDESQQFDDMDVDLPTGTDFEQPSISSYVPSGQVNDAPKLINQNRLKIYCTRLDLSQNKSRMLAKMLREDNLLTPEVTISSQKHRQAAFIPYFTTEADLTFCSDIIGLTQAMQIEYDVNDWRLFIDGSKSGLKVILLHNDNAYMPIPIAYSRVLKETYDSMKLIFNKIKYDDHKWYVSGDLKVVALIMGLSLGRTRNACFICTWVSTAKINHYSATWEKRGSYEVGVMNVNRNSLVKPNMILLPTLHIKLGLVSSFVRKIDKDSDAFKYLAVLFPKLSTAKLKQGDFFQ